MTAVCRIALLVAALLMLSGLSEPTLAQSTGTTVVDLEQPVSLSPLRWLPAGANVADNLSEEPARRLRSEANGGGMSLTAQLGELAFSSSQIFGGVARTSDLSCQSCHTNGHINASFFVPGLSSRPGNFDGSNGLFAPANNDHVPNDRNIPSLRGVAQTAPYGREGRFSSLAEFTRHVIVQEFRGPEPAPWLLDALVAYQRELEFLPHRKGGADAAAVERGRLLFQRPFPKRPHMSCAACHPVDAGFTDRRLHDVGTGGMFDTPSLVNMEGSAPYFHDGSAEDLSAVVSHFNRNYALGLTTTEQSDLLAYLRVVGSVDAEPTAPSLRRELVRFSDQLALIGEAIDRDDGERLDFILRALRQRLEEMHDRLPGPTLTKERSVLIDWSRGLAAVGRAFRANGDAQARLTLKTLRTDVSRRIALVDSAEKQSLYNPDRLRAHFVN